MSAPQSLIESLCQKNVKLARYSSWLVGGSADLFIEPVDLKSLAEIFSAANATQTPVSILGGGTNVLISDQGVRGLVISLRRLTGISLDKTEVQSQATVTAAAAGGSTASPTLTFWALAGTPKSEILKYFLKVKSSAALFLAGLPGQVGGGVVMNAGVSEKLTPREFCEIIEAVEVLRPDGTLEIIDSQKIKWGYRHCEGWRPGIITRVKISYPDHPDEKILQEVKKLNQLRLQKQPLELPSCGSVFVNPPGLSAGRLIEEAGLKGRQVGGAQISVKHGNFIVNKGEATAGDIQALMDICVQTVREKFKIDLRSEVIWLGEK